MKTPRGVSHVKGVRFASTRGHYGGGASAKRCGSYRKSPTQPTCLAGIFLQSRKLVDETSYGLEKDLLAFVDTAHRKLLAFEEQNLLVEKQLADASDARAAAELRVSLLEDENSRLREKAELLARENERNSVESQRLNAELERANDLLSRVALYCLRAHVSPALIASGGFANGDVRAQAERFINELRLLNPLRPLDSTDLSAIRADSRPISRAGNRRNIGQASKLTRRRSKSVDFLKSSHCGFRKHLCSGGGALSSWRSTAQMSSVTATLARTPSMMSHVDADDSDTLANDTYEEVAAALTTGHTLQSAGRGFRTPIKCGNGIGRYESSAKIGSMVSRIMHTRSAKGHEKENFPSVPSSPFQAVGNLAACESVTASLNRFQSAQRNALLNGTPKTDTAGKHAAGWILALKSKHQFCGIAPPFRDVCQACEQGLECAEAYKCSRCFGLCHKGCRNDLALPCMRMRPNDLPKCDLNALAGENPKVSIVVARCVWEIEKRGMDELNFYAVSNAAQEPALALLSKFVDGRLSGRFPSLRTAPVAVVIALLTEYLGCLSPPLVPMDPNVLGAQSKLGQNSTTIMRLLREAPDAHRETACFLALHLKNVVACSATTGSATKLASVFGPLLFGPAVDPKLSVALTVSMVAHVPHSFYEGKLACPSILDCVGGLAVPASPETAGLPSEGLLCSSTRRHLRLD